VKKPKTTFSRHNRKITINESSEIEMNIQDEQNSAVLKNEDTVVNIELDV
jgi:hypothetical protein